MQKNIDKLRAIIVDDSAPTRNLIRKALAEYGCEVVGEAKNGKEALKLYKEVKPDFITMDINMPEMDGIEATRKIKEKDSSAIIIIISKETGKKKEMINNEIDGFLKKPFQPAFLWNRIDFIANKGLLKESLVLNNNKSSINSELIEEKTKNEGTQNIIIENISSLEEREEYNNEKLKISIKPPRDDLFKKIKEKENENKNKSKSKASSEKIEEPILNYTENKKETSKTKKSFIEFIDKVKKIFKK